MDNRRRTIGIAILAALAMLLISMPVQADTIYWTNWTSETVGAPGSASGTIALPTGNVTVTYSGDVISEDPRGAWTPTTAYTGGDVGNAPPGNNSIELTGGYSGTYSLTFSQPVVNPVMAIMSLGGIPGSARMQFSDSNPFTVVATGGPNAYGETGPFYKIIGTNTLYGGTPYNPPQGGGNGTIEFTGTYSTITWHSLDYEHWYLMTAGAPSAINIPIPSTVLLLGSGLVGLGLLRRKWSLKK